MKQYYKFYIYLFLFNFNLLVSKNWDNIDLDNTYLVIKPVCDATVKPAVVCNPLFSAHRLHEFISYSMDKSSKSCPRSNQLLFNEIVTKKIEREHEIEFDCSSCFYLDSNSKQVSTFCTLKNNLISFRDLKNFNIDFNLIPDSHITNLENSVILLMPYRDTKTNVAFSAGTRFSRFHDLDDRNNFGIKYIFLDNAGFNIVYSILPSNISRIEFSKTKKRKIEDFVNLLVRWANASSENFIPYVWGGNSFREFYNVNRFELYESTEHDISYWKRTCPDSLKKPHCGFDCSSLILRACQMCGIPYHYKNTYTLMNSKLRVLKSGEKISKGDIICYVGHVMVIVDPKKDLVVEAVGYGVGAGKIQMVPFKSIYKGVRRIKDILAGGSITRLNSKGEVAGDPVKDVKIFSIESMF